MDSQLLFYDPSRASAPNNKDTPVVTEAEHGPTCLFTEDTLLAVPDLDPSFESNHNIQELINKEGVLFPDLLPSGGSPIDGECGLAGVAPVAETDVVGGVAEQMPEVCNSTGEPAAAITETREVLSSSRRQQPAELVYVDPSELAALGLTNSPDERQTAVEGTLTTTLIADAVSSTAAADQHRPIQFCSVSTVAVPESLAKSTQNDRNRSLKADSPSKSGRRSRHLDKNSEEYRLRRQRNNIAVRKSRDKAKIKQQETENRVKALSEENERLQRKVDLLTKELNVLKSLFTNVGVPVPASLAAVLK